MDNYAKIQMKKTIFNPHRCICHSVWICTGESLGRCRNWLCNCEKGENRPERT